MSKTLDTKGQEWTTVYLFSGAGQFQGNSIISVESNWVEYPGWTVDEAVAFVTTRGTAVCDRFEGMQQAEKNTDP